MSTRSDDSSPRKAPSPPDQFAPLISLVFFGYYGFLSTASTDLTDDTGNTVGLWVAFLWLMRTVTVVLAVSCVAGIAKARWAMPANAGGLLVAAFALAILGIMDILDTTYVLACPTLLLWIFAVWTGWHGVTELSRVLRGGQ